MWYWNTMEHDESDRVRARARKRSDRVRDARAARASSFCLTPEAPLALGGPPRHMFHSIDRETERCERKILWFETVFVIPGDPIPRYRSLAAGRLATAYGTVQSRVVHRARDARRGTALSSLRCWVYCSCHPPCSWSVGRTRSTSSHACEVLFSNGHPATQAWPHTVEIFE